MRDQSEIRGHRKTYIGAMPGRIIQSLKKCSSSNPVFVLDEIDKLSRDSYGDPSSAMLEVLDPEQNKEFYDNYLEIGFDLSKVLFIVTANDISTIQPALRDRMEMINITGYNDINERYLLPKALISKMLKEHGIKNNLKFKNFDLEFIDSYTRESGVRGLEKVLAKLSRSFAVSLALGEKINSNLDSSQITKVLGAKKYSKDMYDNSQFIGVSIGLAWTLWAGHLIY